MSAEQSSIARLSLYEKLSRIEGACESIMLDAMPAVVFDDEILAEKIAEAYIPVGFNNAAELNDYYNYLFSEHIAENARFLTDIFGKLVDRKGQSYGMLPTEAAGHFFGIEMDLGEETTFDLDMHLDKETVGEILAIGVNTLLAGEAEFTTGHGLWLPEANVYTELGVDLFKPEKLGPASIACFVLAGTDAIRPAAHDFVTTSPEGRVTCLQTVQGY